MMRIAKEKHKLFTVEIEKKSLSPFNDKKWITRYRNDFISYSYGHYKIKEEKELVDLLCEFATENILWNLIEVFLYT